MAKSWYIIHTYASYEQKIERTINELITNGELDSSIVTNVKVPMEETIDIRNGKKRTRNNKLLPGYVLLELDLPQLGWKSTCNVIRHIQGVTGFVGTNPNERPRPISNEEVKSILSRAGEIKGEKTVHVTQDFVVGDKVKITEGAFATFEGTVEAIEDDKLKINVEIFGRATPVELGLLQVEKI